MWFIVTLILTFHNPPSVSFQSDRISCYGDSECGQGECWEGYCADTGYCIAYYTCV